jgi:hypothetical protein
MGVSYLVLAPEHPLVDEITTEAHRAEVDAFVEVARHKSDMDRMLGGGANGGTGFVITPSSRPPPPTLLSPSSYLFAPPATSCHLLLSPSSSPPPPLPTLLLPSSHPPLTILSPSSHLLPPPPPPTLYRLSRCITQCKGRPHRRLGRASVDRRECARVDSGVRLSGLRHRRR